VESPFSGALVAARAGSGSAFAWLYSEFSPRILGFFRAQGAAEPDELTNDVFASAFRSLGSFNGDDDAFWSWLYTIARNRLIDEHRRHARRVSTVSADVAGYDDGLPDGDVEAEALDNLAASWVRELLIQLAPDQRDVLALRIIADLTIDQIAATLGKRPGAVKALQRRGLAALRRTLDQQGVPLSLPGDV
jgi:RNA polymerase sigma-70 factor (ECF subfamily)